MGLHHRKLILGATNSTLTRSELVCASFCEPESELNASGRCPSECLSLCSTICRTSNKPHKSHTFLIVSLSLVAAALLLGFGYFFYVKYYSRRRSQPQSDEGTHDNVDHEFIDEDLHGPVLDHPIWYINTVGLQQSIISSITVCQYKKGDGLVEGTECAVCLSEFQEDETLRLLPKCNHAFHVPCVDTWLRSHTNCPMCRAPIVKAVGTPTPEPNLNSIPEEETQVEIMENSGESSGGMETEICEIGVGTEELDDEAEVESPKQRGEISTEVVDGVEPRRRSVSMDSSSASKINLALSNVHAVESNGNSNSQLVIAVNKSNRGTGPKRIGGNQKLQRQKGNSSKGRSLQSGPLIMKRSSSSDGKFPFCRDVQNSDSVFPLRSF